MFGEYQNVKITPISIDFNPRSLDDRFFFFKY